MPGILVALDDSVGSQRALEAAVKLAQQNGGTVSALTVLDRPGDPRLEQLTKGVKPQARDHLQELLQTAANFASSRGVHLKPILCEGHPANTIIDCAYQQQASLVVLGANSDGTADAGLGGTADQVSSHCPCTVLLVKS